MYVIYRWGECIYAATDPVRFNQRVSRLSRLPGGLDGITFGLTAVAQDMRKVSGNFTPA